MGEKTPNPLELPYKRLEFGTSTSKSSSLEVYPNPADHEIHIVLKGDGQYQISLFHANLHQLNPIIRKYKSDSVLSRNDLIQLKLIANLCPYYDGIAVYYSRSILASLGYTSIINECEITKNPFQSPKQLLRKKSKITKGSVFVYPNPVRDHLIIEYEIKANEKVKFQIIDILGRINFEIELSSANMHAINIEGLKNGMYFFNFIQNNNIIKQGKLLKE